MIDDIAAFEQVVEDADLEFLTEQIPLAVNQSLEGLARVANIVRAMKEFAHPGSGDFTPCDLNHAVESMVTVTRNEWKYVADMETDLDPNLPPIPCLVGDLNQVVINLIVNAAQAIAEKRDKTNSEQKGQLKVKTATSACGSYAEILISDNGMGIPEGIRGRVFDPFFTTKNVGKGTGQGLAIAYSVIADKHGGDLQFDTEEGQGTTFTIRIPKVRPSREAASSFA